MKKDMGKVEAAITQLQIQSKTMKTQIAQMGQHISSLHHATNHFPN